MVAKKGKKKKKAPNAEEMVARYRQNPEASLEKVKELTHEENVANTFQDDLNMKNLG